MSHWSCGRVQRKEIIVTFLLWPYDFTTQAHRCLATVSYAILPQRTQGNVLSTPSTLYDTFEYPTCRVDAGVGKQTVVDSTNPLEADPYS